jgi:hypothetical protein
LTELAHQQSHEIAQHHHRHQQQEQQQQHQEQRQQIPQHRNNNDSNNFIRPTTSHNRTDRIGSAESARHVLSSGIPERHDITFPGTYCSLPWQTPTSIPNQTRIQHPFTSHRAETRRQILATTTAGGGRNLNNVIQGTIHQTWTEVLRFFSVFHSAAADAWHEQQQQQQQDHQCEYHQQNMTRRQLHGLPPPMEAFQYYKRGNYIAANIATREDVPISQSPLSDFGLSMMDDGLLSHDDEMGTTSQSDDNVNQYTSLTSASWTPSLAHEYSLLNRKVTNDNMFIAPHKRQPWWRWWYGPIIRGSDGKCQRSTHHQLSLDAQNQNNTTNSFELINRTEDENDHNDSTDEFIFLPQLRWQPSLKDGWGAAGNLDVFFTRLYHYYYHRGFTPIFAMGLVKLVILWFTLWLSVILLAYVDWIKLATCIDETTCHSDFFESYTNKSPFSHLTAGNLLIYTYMMLFTMYGVFASWSFYRNLIDAVEARFVFEERLGISSRKLAGGAVDWDRDVVQTLIRLQDSGEYRIAINEGVNLNALLIAQRILRKENFMVAFFNRKLLDLQVPFLGNEVVFCTSLEVSPVRY